MEIFRGDIYYVNPIGYSCYGSEQGAGRPAVIVSNNKNNTHSGVVEVVYLTSKPKKQLSTHVPIRCKVMSTALCEQVHSIDKERLSDYIRRCTEIEMQQIDDALRISLSLPLQKQLNSVELNLQSDIARITAERDVYKKLYEQLLENSLKGCAV